MFGRGIRSAITSVVVLGAVLSGLFFSNDGRSSAVENLSDDFDAKEYISEQVSVSSEDVFNTKWIEAYNKTVEGNDVVLITPELEIVPIDETAKIKLENQIEAFDSASRSITLAEDEFLNQVKSIYSSKKHILEMEKDAEELTAAPESLRFMYFLVYKGQYCEYYVYDTYETDLALKMVDIIGNAKVFIDFCDENS